jgi:hypothetical protein
MKRSLLFVSLLAATALAAPVANATVLLTFGQTGSGDTVTGTRVGSTTTITSSAAVDITEIAAPLLIPIPAIFTLSTTSAGPATVVGTDIEQRYSGSFSITNASDTINYLSGTFSDAMFGSGGSLTLNASGPGESVTFTSSVIPSYLIPGLTPSVAMSFTDVHPNAHITSGTLGSFKSDVSGDFSSTVPEPSTWVMLALGFIGLGYAAVRRSAKDRKALAI